MLLINRTKNTILGKEVFIADRPFLRIKGLLGKKELSSGQALVLKPCHSIHTFFMRFPIDCLFVDKNYRVIKAISNLRPFRLTGIYLASSLAIELPAGTIKLTSTQENDIVEFLT